LKATAKPRQNVGRRNMGDLEQPESGTKRKKGPIREGVGVVAELQPPWRRDFGNAKLEWRRLFAEILGTFFLVLVAVGGDIVGVVSKGAISPIAEVIAPGLMVMAIVLFMGKVSGAHLNPTVSISFAARGDFPWRRFQAML
jgi:aquaporin Z